MAERNGRRLILGVRTGSLLESLMPGDSVEFAVNPAGQITAHAADRLITGNAAGSKRDRFAAARVRFSRAQSRRSTPANAKARQTSSLAYRALNGSG
ncbi:MAG: hypothetical protein LBU72_01135 [Burkholderiaceae bacterium]|jgi:hypothetical protein|nr:hypothetical protein [Burkholderiaceae bacterium]